MDTQTKIILAAKATKAQKQKIKAFCRETLRSQSKVSLSHFIGDSFELCLTFFENRPEIYIGILSMDDKKIHPEEEITDDDLDLALKALAIKYAFATTRQNPVANKVLINAWNEFIKSDIPKEEI